MFQHIHLHMNERAILVRNGKPERALGPGRYTFWKRYEVTRWNTDDVTFTAPAIILGILPVDWYETVHLAPGHYGIVLRDERAVAFLRPGIHRVWKVEANVALRVFVETDALPEITDELRKVIPRDELLEAHVETNGRRRPGRTAAGAEDLRGPCRARKADGPPHAPRAPGEPGHVHLTMSIFVSARRSPAAWKPSACFL